MLNVVADIMRVAADVLEFGLDLLKPLKSAVENIDVALAEINKIPVPASKPL